MKSFIAAVLMFTAVSACGEQVSVDFGSTIGPLIHAGNGILHSVSATSPSDDLLTPINPQLFRAFPWGTQYDRAAALGADYQVVVSDVYNYAAIYSGTGTLPGDNGEWSVWENTCRDMAMTALAQNKRIDFDLWNEPDQPFFWNRSHAQFFETWKHGVQAIRQVDPSATVVGPSVSNYWWFTNLGVEEFLTYAKANDVLPDVISWHTWNHNVDAEISDLKEFAAANGIDASRISINEFLPPEDAYHPGAMPYYFDAFESNGVESAAKSCWGTCFDTSLDGLLTNSGQPRSIWWAYERYASMTGSTVLSASGGSLDAVASRDEGIAYALVGRSANNSTPANVLLENLDDIPSLLSSGQVHVLAELISNSETGASSGPVVMIDANFTTNNGQLLLNLPNFGAYDAYALTLTKATGLSPLTYLWNGNAGAAFENPLNWSPSGVPTSEDNFEFGSSAVNAVVLPNSGFNVVHGIELLPNANPVTLDAVAPDTPLDTTVLTLGASSSLTLVNTRLQVNDDLEIPNSGQISISATAALDTGSASITLPANSDLPIGQGNIQISGGRLKTNSLSALDTNRIIFMGGEIDVTGTSGFDYGGASHIYFSDDSIDSSESLQVTNGPLTVSAILNLNSGGSITASAIAGIPGSLRIASSGISLHVTGNGGLAIGGDEAFSAPSAIVVGAGSAIDVNHTLTVLPLTGNPTAVTLQEDGGGIYAHDIVVDGGYLESSHAGGLQIAPHGTVEIRNGGKLKLSGFDVDGGRSIDVGNGALTAGLESASALLVGGTGGDGTVTIHSSGALVLSGSGATVDSGGLLEFKSGSSYLMTEGGAITVNSGGTIKWDASVHLHAGNSLVVSGGLFQSLEGVSIGDGVSGVAIANFSAGAAGTFGNVLQLGNGAATGQVLLSESAALTAGAVDIGRGSHYGPGDLSSNNRLSVSGGANLTPLAGTGAMPIHVGNANPGVSGNELRITANGMVDTGTAPTAIHANGTLFLEGGTLTTDQVINEGVFSFTSGTLAFTGAGGYTIGAMNGLGASPVLSVGQMLEVTNATTVPADQVLTLAGGTLQTSNLVADGTGRVDFQNGALTAESIDGTGSVNMAADEVHLHVTGPQGITLGDGYAVQGSNARTVTVGLHSSVLVDGTLTVRTASLDSPPESLPVVPSLTTTQDGFVQATAVVIEGGRLDTNMGTNAGLRMSGGGAITVRADATGRTGNLNLADSTIDGERRLIVESGGHVTYDGTSPLVIGDPSGGDGTIIVERDGALQLLNNGAVISHGGLLELKSGSKLIGGSGETIAINSGGELRVSGTDFQFPNDTNLEVIGGIFNASDGTRFSGSTNFGSTSATFHSGAVGTFGSALNLNVPLGGSGQPQLTNASLVISGGSQLTAGAVTIGNQDSSNSVLTVAGTNSRLTPLASSMPLTVGGSNSSNSVAYILDHALVDTGDADTQINGGGNSIVLDGGTLKTNRIIANGGVFTFTSGTLALTRSTDYTVGAASELGANPTLTPDRRLEITNDTTIPAGQTFTLDGGTLNTGGLRLTGGRLAFNSGSLGITGTSGVTIGPGGLLGSSLSIGSAQTVSVTHAITINAGASLVLNGTGQFGSDTINNGGTILLNGGALTTESGVTNSSSGRLFVASGVLATLNGPAANAVGGRITLQGGAAQLNGTGVLTNSGLLQGDGECVKAVTNASGGEIRVGSSDALLLSGANGMNTGRINVLGGTIEFSQPLTNSSAGVINGRGAFYFSSGLMDHGQMQFSGGNSDIFGDVSLVGGTDSGAKIMNAAGGNVITFYGNVVHNGSEIRTAAGSTSLFFGNVSGAGNFTGAGETDMEGNYAPGNSPATVRTEGSLRLGTHSLLTMELAGPLPGNQYDQLHVGGSLTIDGMLNVALIDGFTPTSGQSFDLLDWGDLTGTFAAVSLPTLPGLTWDITQLYSSGVLKVASAGIAGDYNSDGSVDAADFVTWRKYQGTSGTLHNDPTGGIIGAAQYDIWRSHYGQSASSGTGALLNVSVPEPASMVLFLYVVLAIGAPRRVTVRSVWGERL